MQLTVKFLNGETCHLEVDPSITVGELKRRIQSSMSGDAPARLKLSAKGIDFSNDSSTLSAIGLQSGSYIMALIQDSIQVFLKNEKGQIKSYGIEPGEKVIDFKHKVYNNEKVPEDQQVLIYNGKQLEDHRKLEDYGIESKSTIYLTLRLRGG